MLTFAWYSMGFAIGALTYALVGYHAFLAAAILCGAAGWSGRRAD